MDYILFSEGAEREWRRLLVGEKYAVSTWQPQKQGVSDFARTLGEYDLLITARFHGAVIGTLLGIPCICIAVEQKLEIAATQYKSIKLWAHPFREGDLASCVDDTFSRYDVVSAEVREDLRQQRTLGAQMSERFGNLLRELTGQPCGGKWAF